MTQRRQLQLRLVLLSFLQFAAWGAYLTSMGGFLGRTGQTSYEIGWFYSVQGLVSIFMPALMGIVADRFMRAERVLGLCHLLAGGFMLAAGIYGVSAGADYNVWVLFSFYALSVAFYMPTLALSNSVAFSALKQGGMDTVKDFPPIRVFGTIGFICTMLAVDFMGVQHTPIQFIVSGCISVVLAFYSPTLPACPVKGKEASTSLIDSLGLKAFSLFKDKRMAIFFIFSFLLGLQLQISNGFANPFISSFAQVGEFSDVFFSKHANLLISLSQMSETLCILLIPFCMKRFGIKRVMLIAMGAWVFRFGFFGLGNPAFPGVTLFMLSCIVYGVAFDFFNISGALFVDQNTSEDIRSSAQGLFMLMTNGLGAFLGSLGAAAVVKHFVPAVPDINEVPILPDALADQLMSGWQSAWFVFAGYALVVFVLFWLCFKEKK